jgi:hypothetical protein
MLGITSGADAAYTSIHGGACYPYGDATTASGMGNTGFSRPGMSIQSTQPGPQGKLFFCPIERVNAGSSGTVQTLLTYTRANPQATSYMYCNMGTYDIYGNTVQSTFGGYIQSSGTSYVSFAPIAQSGFGANGALCFMGQYDKILVINSTEN